MAKTHVIDATDGSRTPFLRGILTGSLHDAGLSFDDAYRLASTVRGELTGVDAISSEELRARVLSLLKNSHSRKIVEAYLTAGRLPARVMVKSADGQLSAFSESQHLRCLESCGLSAKDAEAASKQIYQHLFDNGITEISSQELAYLTYNNLYGSYGLTVARRYLVWVDYMHSGRPLILLIGGATGTGKSTIATELAHRLGVARTQSTDMLREVMRIMIPQRLLPELHISSFDAWEVLPIQPVAGVSKESLLANGYLRQMELLSVPCEAVIQRALRERVSLILEGVHVHPSLVERVGSQDDAVIVPIMLAVLKKERLKQRLRGRGELVPGRGNKRYLEKFQRIWTLQSFLLSEADTKGVPIIANDDIDRVAVEIMSTIVDVMAEGFSATPSEVFGHGH